MDFGSILTNQPRGLYNFISEIRNAKSKDDERMRVDKELANIRNKFSNPASLSSYDKKKYVWKMCYIYMLGYEVDFGHVEFISLLSSTKYQEKAVGYMAFSLMFRPGDEMMTLAINSMRNDIIGHSNHGQSLALAAVSNIGGNDLAEALASDVQRLIISPLDHGPNYHSGLNAEVEFRNKSLLCKKAALCLLRLYRTNPDCVVVDEWMSRLARLLEDRDLGVVTSVMSLLLGLASNAPHTFEPLVPYVVSILTRLVVNRSCSPDYFYYGIASPWLQVKCLRFLQYYKIPDTVDMLTEVLVKLMVKSDNNADSYNKQNAENSVLFECISLVISYGQDAPQVLRDYVHTWLGRMIATKDPNIRYLGIDAMTRLAKLDGADAVQVYQSTVLESLKDTDISLRKRALTLLYVMTNSHNVREVVGELVSVLPYADSTMKEDIVVKIAILSEKYCEEDWRWYVDTMCAVIVGAGDYVSEAVWHRVVHIIMRNTPIHEYTAEKVLVHAQSKYCHATMLQLSAYVLGEVGVCICERPGMTGYEQFAALHQHFAAASATTQAQLLTCYAKLVNLYPEQVRDLVCDIYAKLSTTNALELQQRAVEYNALLQENASVVEAVLNTIPAYELDKSENVLMTQEERNTGATADRPAWAVDAVDKAASRQAYVESRAGHHKGDVETAKPAASYPTPAPAAPLPQPTKIVDLLSLDDDDIGGGSGGAFGDSFGSGGGGGASTSLSDEQLAQVERNGLAAAVNKGLQNSHKLLTTSHVEILLAHDYRAHQGRVVLSIRNLTSSTLSSLAVQWPGAEALAVKVALPATHIAGHEETVVQISADCMRPFDVLPPLDVSFSLGGSQFAYAVPLPLSVCLFAEPLPMDKNTYMTRWKAITGPDHEQQLVFPSSKPVASQLAFVKANLFPAGNVGIASELDTTDRTFTGALTVHTGTMVDGKRVCIGALLRLEGDVSGNKWRITVRATNAVVARGVKNFFVKHLGA